MRILNILKTDQYRPDFDTIEKAAEVLTKGGLIIAPTETNYGFLGRTDRDEVVKKIFNLKQRSLNLPTAIFVRSLKEIDFLADLNRTARKLARTLLPGPLTLILSDRAGFPAPIVTDHKIGIRYSSSPLIDKIMNRVDFNLTATSANLSGQPTPETIDIAADIFGVKVDLYLDSGRLNSLPSTVVDCTGENYRILRTGVYGPDEIEKAMKEN
nr:threonylcarbamoyl-AMP synthase [candidate division Zixibacteria bacterium]